MMTAAVMAATREMLIVTLTMASPVLAAAILASFVVGLLQAGTRINDLTLSFVPRFVAVLLVIYLTAAWAAVQMTGYIEQSVSALQISLE